MNTRRIFVLALLGQVLALVPFAHAQEYEKVFDFTEAREADAANRGGYPRAGLVQGSDGNFYGTTQQGGENVIGTVFKMTAAGELTTLVEFTGNQEANKGAYPAASLVQGSDGNFYGTTTGGLRYVFTFGYGTVFKMTPGGVLTTLVEFSGTSGPNKGAYPGADLVPGSAGGAGLVQGSDGYFYGTTRRGGVNDFGTVFKINPAGGPGALTTLVEFAGNETVNKGAFPGAGLVLGSDGYFYGTTSGNDPEFGIPASFVNNGTVFRINPAGGPGALETLVEFTGLTGTNRGQSPNAGLLQDSGGNFYGTTFRGGANNLGTVFKLTPTGMVTLVDFTGNGGSLPQLGLVQGSDGNFYGTTFNGGASGLGTVFKMVTNGTTQGTTLTTLVHFTGNGASGKGYNAGAGLVQGSNGHFYGTTILGSPINGVAQSYGTVFEMATDGTAPGTTLTTLVEFTGDGISEKGRKPFLGVQDSDGNFYGTSINGGAKDIGTVFKMTPAGQVTTLVEFTGTDGPNKGAYPRLRMVEGSDGNFYMTTEQGGNNGLGTVFMITPQGVLTTLLHFDGTNGSRPLAGLIRDGSQTFYGTTERGGIGFNGDVNSGNGTVFKLVTDGTFAGTHLDPLVQVQFTGNVGPNKGKAPSSSLVKGNDGHLYGTTHEGGMNGVGTVFKINPAGGPGALMTLVEFTGTGGPGMKEGAYPYGGLLKGLDGNLYGTTKHGGSSFDIGNPRASYGTVFKMTPAGALTTLVEFTGIGGAKPGSYPYGDLVQDSDGNFYGTTNEGGVGDGIAGQPDGFGTTFKMVTDGTLGGTTLTNIREFLGGVDGEAQFGGLIAAADGNLYGTTSGGDRGGAGTIYRLIFPGVPTVALRNVSLEHTSAVVDAYVTARGASTDVWLVDFGTDGVDFEDVPLALNVTGFQTKLIGTTLDDLTVFRPNLPSGENLTPGTTYHYRILAMSSQGMTISPPMASPPASFSTLAEPIALVNAASNIGPHSAQFNGKVNARNFDTTVFFEWGTDGVIFPFSEPAGAVPAMPANALQSVSVLVTHDSADRELFQGTTHYYRIRAVNAGGPTVSAVQSFTTTIAAGPFSDIVHSLPAPVLLQDRQGFLTVNLIPDGILSGWRFAGEQQWRGSGTQVSGFVTSDRVIEYRPVPGFETPSPEPVAIVSGAEPTVVTGAYLPNGSGVTGAMKITIKPDSVALPTLQPNVSQRAQWRLLGEDDMHWRDTGVTLPGLALGTYLVEFKELVGETPERATPTPIIVNVTESATPAEPVNGSTIYFLASAPSGATPAMVSFETVNESSDLPYQCVGQLLSDSGTGSGFVVKPRVVATAAHVVYDDVNRSNVTGLQWLFQRDKGTYEPEPQIPLATIIYTGYAARRDMETPGQSSPVSQNLDVAAVVFLEDVGRGGYSGYLASNTTPNEWLTTSLPKTLVGYPTDSSDGISQANQGRMHATPPTTAAFNPEFEFTYSTSAIRGGNGNSGGPLCVQFSDDHRYYPAAIFLGGTGQSVVRAIDPVVTELFATAQTMGSGGDNQGDGGYSMTYSPLAGASSKLTVIIIPSTAQWIYLGQPFNSGDTRMNILPDTATISFTDEHGYRTPGDKEIPLSNASHPGRNSVTVTVTYNGLTKQPPNRRVTAFETTSFAVQNTGIPTSFRWKRNGSALVNGPSPTGSAMTVSGASSAKLTLNSVRAIDAGIYSVDVTWPNGMVTSDDGRGTLSVDPKTQTISFNPTTRAFGDPPFTLNAVATSPLQISYEVLSGPAMITNINRVTLTGVGTVRIRASQGGSGNYLPADVERSFRVTNPNLVVPSGGTVTTTGGTFESITIGAGGRLTLGPAPAAEGETDQVVALNNILADDSVDGYTPTIKVSESISEKLRVIKNGSSRDGNVATRQWLSATVVANLSQFSLTEISETMPFAVSIGGFNFAGTLGDDGARRFGRAREPERFDATKQSAIFYLTEKPPATDRQPPFRKVGYVRFSWDSTRLRVRVLIWDAKAAGIAGAFDRNAIAAAAVLDPNSSRMSHFHNEPIELRLNFGSAVGARTVFGRGLQMILRNGGAAQNGRAHAFWRASFIGVANEPDR